MNRMENRARNEQQMYEDISRLTKAVERLVRLLEKLAQQQS
jgi:ubiquinone biosynthesis protein UbiJ